MISLLYKQSNASQKRLQARALPKATLPAPPLQRDKPGQLAPRRLLGQPGFARQWRDLHVLQGPCWRWGRREAVFARVDKANSFVPQGLLGFGQGVCVLLPVRLDVGHEAGLPLQALQQVPARNTSDTLSTSGGGQLPVSAPPEWLRGTAPGCVGECGNFESPCLSARLCPHQQALWPCWQRMLARPSAFLVVSAKSVGTQKSLLRNSRVPRYPSF
jgi:hypothetical protein